MNFEMNEAEVSAGGIEKIRELAVLGMGKSAHPAGGELVLLPEGYRLEHLKPVDAPISDHIRQAVRLDDQDSFTGYVNDYKIVGETRVFADIAANSMVAVIDYHREKGEALNSFPCRCAHRAVYALPVSEQWKRWTRVDGKLIPQREFAEFVEENIADVVEPAGADLLEIAKSLQSTKNVEFKSAMNLSNGTTQLIYAENEESKHSGKQTLHVPQKIKLGIPVYFGDEPYEVEAFFRYRLDEGKLGFIVKIHRREMILQDAFNRKAVAIGEAVDLPVFYGAMA